MRLDRPSGLYALNVPCLFGVFYAAVTSPPQTSFAFITDPAVTLLLWCLLARRAACTWNNAVDQDFDKKVARCRLRPIARGDVTRSQAHMWAVFQTLAIIAILLRSPIACMCYFSVIILLATIYPFAKRFTYFPQSVLESIFSVAFLTSVQSLNVNPSSKEILASSLCFFAANTVWTIIYDAIHAHQDVADDVHAGVKSMAVKLKISTKTLTSLLACVMTGVFADLGPLYIFPRWENLQSV